MLDGVATLLPTSRSRLTNGAKMNFCVDARSADARRFRDLAMSFADDAGGAAALTEAQRALVKQAAMLTIQSEKLQAAMLQGEAVNVGTRSRSPIPWRGRCPALGAGLLVREPARDQHGKYQPGASANPAGRPLGSRNKVTAAVEKLLNGEAEELTRTCINLAKTGDSTALRLCIERLCAPTRERPISIDLPHVSDVSGVPPALASVLGSVATGEITPSDGGALCGMLGAVSKAFETAELAQRLAALERALNLSGGTNVG
jgi:hypothetical protein